MDRIRSLREGRGWSQSELAARAGVTRQLIGAVESSRHSPNVAAALGIARALGVTVEQLFAETDTGVTSLLQIPIAPGSPVLAAEVGRRLVAMPLTSGVESTEAWAVADAVATAEGVAWLPDRAAQRLVIAGCDPVLGMLAGLVERASTHRLLTVHASTDRSIDALLDGRAHGAVVHAPSGGLPQAPANVRRWHVASWQVGLAGGPAGDPPSLTELAEGNTPVVQRESGAGSQRALLRALRSVGGGDHLPGPVADGHVDVARRIAHGGGRAGITMEAAANAFDLGFSPLEVHDVELWVTDEWLAMPAVSTLLEMLTSASFSQRAALLGGYDLRHTGVERRAS